MLIDARVPVVDPSVEALIKSNLIFWRRSLAKLEELQAQRGLDEQDATFLGGPRGEGIVEQVGFNCSKAIAQVNLSSDDVQALENMRGFTIVRGDLLKSQS
jgi:hypothetical protein